MKIGVQKSAEGERRVALVPDVVKSLKAGERLDVLVSSGAWDADVVLHVAHRTSVPDRTKAALTVPGNHNAVLLGGRGRL